MPSIPEYRKVRQYVLNCIAQHKDPDKRISSERELAAIMNVSRLTVRYSLKELIKDGWLTVRKGEGMFIPPERCGNRYGLQHQNLKVMLIWDDGSLIMLDGFFAAILEELCSVFKSLPVFLQNPVFTGGMSMIREEIQMNRPDGIIWIRPPSGQTALINELRKEIPVCILGNQSGSNDFSMSFDFKEAGRISAEYFMKHNCRTMAFLGGESAWEIRHLMIQGWKETILKQRGTYDESLDICLETVDWNQQLESVLKKSPDGIFIFGNAYQILDRMLAKTQNKKIRILTDENFWGTYQVVRQPDAKLILVPKDMVKSAARELFKVMNNPKSEQKETIFKPIIKEKKASVSFS